MADRGPEVTQEWRNAVLRWMHDAGINRSELATRTNASRGMITQLFSVSKTSKLVTVINQMLPDGWLATHANPGVVRPDKNPELVAMSAIAALVPDVRVRVLAWADLRWGKS
jgi:hypothetical protein